LSDVLANYSTNVRRNRTYVYPTDSSSSTLLVSTSEISTDGLRTWQTIYRDGSTAVVTTNRTVFSTGGNRYETNSAPDGSYVVSALSYGRLASVTRKNASGTQIGQTTYTYDAHNRQSAVTDARNGPSTYGYDNADRVTSVTTPAPGNGQSAQTTTSVYNNMGQVTQIIQPDGTSVNNEYYLTGELKRNYGSRTYPVGYSYDAQGRLKTMTNWTAYPSAGTSHHLELRRLPGSSDEQSL